MKVFISVASSKQGITSLLSLVIGILIAVLGGKLFAGSRISDVLVLCGSLLAIVGTQTFSTLLIAMRNDAEKEAIDDDEK